MITPKQVHKVAVEHGFWDKERNVGEAVMLVVSELSEALEADRLGDKTNFDEEIVDAIIRLFDLAEGWGIDVNKTMRVKHNINKSHPYLHGKEY